MIETFEVVTLASSGAAIAAALSGMAQAARSKRLHKHEPSLEDRAKQVGRELGNAIGLIGRLEKELSAKMDAVQNLQRQQRLLELDKSQIEAVQRALEGSVRRESRKGIWINAGMSAFFFVAGVLATLWVT